MNRQPVPPFTKETALKKVRAAEDGWNTRNPEKVANAYTPHSKWRNRISFIQGREDIQDFLKQKWKKENDYRLIKELWLFSDDRIAVRYAYEWRSDTGQWHRSYGNENWRFSSNGLMAERHASINDLPINENERLFLWPLGPRPENHPGLSELGL